jgi:germination protein M
MTCRWPAAVLALTLTLGGCAPRNHVLDAGAAPTGRSAQTSPAQPSAAPSEEPPAPSEDVTPADREEDAGAVPQNDPRDDGGDGGESGTTDRPTTTVSVYLTRGEGVEPVQRVVPQVPRIGSAAVEQLLAGPTDAEAAAGYGTHIPAGTRLRDLAITDGVAVVDLSSEFDAGASTFGVSLRLAQVACTLDAFVTVDGVRFAIDGQVVDVFDGDGQVTDRPVACGDYARTGADELTPPPIAPS